MGRKLCKDSYWQKKCKHLTLEVAYVTISHSTLARINQPFLPHHRGQEKNQSDIFTEGTFIIYLKELGILVLRYTAFVFCDLFGNSFLRTIVNIFSFLFSDLFVYVLVYVCFPVHSCIEIRILDMECLLLLFFISVLRLDFLQNL